MNEVLARAITGIDDELILSADRPVFSKRKIIVMKRFSLCAAACLVLLGGIFFLSRNSSKLEISVNGTAVSSQPIAVMSSNTRQIAPASNDITVPLDFALHGDLTLTAVDGTIEVYSAKTNEQLCVGQSCKTQGPVTVQWILANPDHDRTYELQVNDQEATLILHYEPTTNNWMIRKSED